MKIVRGMIRNEDPDPIIRALEDCANLNCARALYDQPDCGECTTCRARAALADYWDVV